MFADYKRYLALPFSPDYWSDEGISSAVTLLGDFTEADWIALRTEWRSMPASWRLRSAETLDGVVADAASKLLIEMLQDPAEAIVIAAADALRFRPEALTLVTPEALARITLVLRSAGPATQAALADFLAQATAASP